MIDVALVFLDGGHASTGIGPFEVFRDAGVLWNRLHGENGLPHFSVRTASIDGGLVRPDVGYAIQPECSLAEIGTPDLLFVPAAGLDLDEVLRENGPIVDAIRRLHARGTRIAGVCTGVSLLAAAGVLDGRRATTHWSVARAYAERFPDVLWEPDALVTEDRGVYCGGGVHAALDLSLYLVERLADRQTAIECSKALLIDMPRPCQAGFAVLPMGAEHADEAVQRAERWIHQHCREEIRFEALARELGMSPRNFVRRFKEATGIAPIDYLQRLRIRAARQMIEDDQGSIQEIGLRVGYRDAAHFRDLFKRHTGLAPTDYRRRFGTRATAHAT